MYVLIEQSHEDDERAACLVVIPAWPFPFRSSNQMNDMYQDDMSLSTRST